MGFYERIAVIGGADPTDPLEPDNRMRHTAAGVLVLTVASWAFIAATLTFQHVVHVPWPLALLAGVLVALVILGIDLALTSSPLKRDSLGARLAVVGLRGAVSVAVGLVIAHATILLMYSSSLTQLVSRTNEKAIGGDTTAIIASSPDPATIAAAETQIKSDRAGLQQAEINLGRATAELDRRKQAWLADRICVHGDKAADGNFCGVGDVEKPLETSYRDFLNHNMPAAQATHDRTVKALTADIATETTTASTARQDLNNQIARGTKPDQDNTGLIAQSKALSTLLRQDWFAWLWVVFFIVIDLSVAFLKAVLPESDFDLRRREAREHRTQLVALGRNAPVLAEAAQHIANNNARAAMARSDAQLARTLEGIRVDRLQHRPSQTRKRFIWPAAATLLAVALVLTVVSDSRHAGATRTMTHPGAAPVPAATRPVKAITINVSPRRAATVNMAGIGTVAVPKGAFTKNGSMTVTPSTATPPRSAGITATETGFDVSFKGTRLLTAATLSFPTSGRPSANAMPIIAHLGDGGRWNYLPVVMSGKLATVQTMNFSPNILGWLEDVGNWADDIMDSVDQAVASAVAGRTPPLTCSGAPSWLHLTDGHSDLVHVCAKDAGADGNGVDRAEIQIKSNRGVSIEVTVPGNPQYVWVDNQSFNERRLVANALGYNPNETVILPAGATMTVGYTQPSANQSYSFDVNGTTTLAMADTLLREVINTIVDDSSNVVPQFWFSFTEITCATGLTVGANGLSTSTSFSGMLNCFKDHVVAQLQNQVSADAIARQLGESGAPPEAQSLAARIPDAAAIAALLPAFQVGWGNVIDTIKSGVTHGASSSVDFSLDGPTPAAPTIAPGSPGDIPNSTTGGGEPQSGASTGQQGQGRGAAESGAPIGETPRIPITGPTTPPPTSSMPAAPTPTRPAPYVFYNNYANTTDGIPMCRGTQTNSRSTPGGTATETFIAAKSGTISSAKVDIDPAPGQVTAHAVLSVNGLAEASDDQTASGDVLFAFGSVNVSARDQVALTISFTASAGTIITVYQVGSPAGTLNITNSCLDDTSSFTTKAGLRAVVSGSA